MEVSGNIENVRDMLLYKEILYWTKVWRFCVGYGHFTDVNGS